MRIRLTLAILLVATVVSGCSHNLTLISRQGGGAGDGVAEELGKKVTINLNGKIYTGQYVFGGGTVAFTNSYGSAAAYSGAGTATAYGSGMSTTYMPGSGNGRVLATSADGDAIRCEFQYSSGNGIGVCTDNAENVYDLQIN